jgi:ubiquinone/menaquinone biosynthesis C-methylase UbiE
VEKDEYKIMHDIEQSYWWFVGKQNLVRSILKSLSLSRHSDRILDIGCGTGIILKLSEAFGRGYGIDLSAEAIRYTSARDLNLIVRSDASQSIPFKGDTFSAITCLDVLEHLDNDFNILSEMMRVCKPGGHIVLTVPAFNVLWSSHDVALHHRRRYTRKQMIDKVRQLNCRVSKNSYYNTILFIPILIARKLKPLLRGKQNLQSDLFVSIPRQMNSLLTSLFVFEIRCLQFMNFPFGVSLLLIIQKPLGDSVEIG